MSGASGSGASGSGGVDPTLLELVVCPDCHGELRVDDAGPGETSLVCRSCGLAYPVRDGIPVLLVDEARRPG